MKKFTLFVEAVDVVATAETFVVNEDLGNCAQSRFFDEFQKSFVVICEIDFLVFRTERIEEGFSFDAERAEGFGVYGNHRK